MATYSPFSRVDRERFGGLAELIVIVRSRVARAMSVVTACRRCRLPAVELAVVQVNPVQSRVSAHRHEHARRILLGAGPDCSPDHVRGECANADGRPSPSVEPSCGLIGSIDLQRPGLSTRSAASPIPERAAGRERRSPSTRSSSKLGRPEWRPRSGRVARSPPPCNPRCLHSSAAPPRAALRDSKTTVRRAVLQIEVAAGDVQVLAPRRSPPKPDRGRAQSGSRSCPTAAIGLRRQNNTS